MRSDADQATALIGFRTAAGPIRITPTDIVPFSVDIAAIFKAISFIR